MFFFFESDVQNLWHVTLTPTLQKTRLMTPGSRPLVNGAKSPLSPFLHQTRSNSGTTHHHIIKHHGNQPTRNPQGTLRRECRGPCQRTGASRDRPQKVPRGRGVSFSTHQLVCIILGIANRTYKANRHTFSAEQNTGRSGQLHTPSSDQPTLAPKLLLSNLRGSWIVFL